jgi:hypothetical protein
MARGRLQTSGAPLVDTGIPTLSPAVVAQPVDTFVHPAVDTQAAQLATALGKLSPSLANLGNVLQENKNQGQLEAGRNEASRLHRLGLDYAAEVKAGRLAINNNPFFKAGLNEVQGQNAADDFGAHMTAAFGAAMAEGGSLSTSTNIEDYRKFAAGISADYAKAHDFSSADPRFLTGFSGRADAIVSAYENKFAEGITQRSQQQATEAIYTQIRNHTLSELRRGTSLDEIAKGFVSQYQFWAGNIAQGIPGLGIKGSIVNRTQYAAVVDAAHELSRSNNDMDRHLAEQALSLLDKVPGGAPGSGPLSNQPFAAQFRAQEDGIHDNVNQGDNLAAQRAQQAKREQADALSADIAHDVLTNPYDPSWRVKLDALTRLDPQAGQAALGFAGSILNEPTQSNRALADQFFRRVYLDDSLTIPEIMRAVRPYGLTRQDAADLIERYTQRQQQKKEKDPLNDPVFTRLIAQVPGQFTQFLPGAGDTWFAAENHEAAYSVVANLMAAWSTEIPKHPEWTDADKLKFYNKQLEVASALQPESARPRHGIIRGEGAIQPPAFAEPQWHTRPIVSPEEFRLLKDTDWTHPDRVPRRVQQLIFRLGPQLQGVKISVFLEAQDALVNPVAPPATSK